MTILALRPKKSRNGIAYQGSGAGNSNDRWPGKIIVVDQGTKRSIIVEEEGGPLGAVIAGANVHDTKLLAKTIESIVVERPEVTEEAPQHPCLDKAYDNPTGREAAAAEGHTPHIRRIGEEKAVPRGEKNTSRGGE